jgi:hypothetical protein
MVIIRSERKMLAFLVLTLLFVSLKFRIYGTGLIVIVLFFIISAGSVEMSPLYGLAVVVSLSILFQRLSVREMKAGRFMPDSGTHPLRARIVRLALFVGIACRVIITILERYGYW